MESEISDPVLPFAYPVGSASFARQLAHIGCKISGRSLLKLDEDRNSIGALAKNPSADMGLLLMKVRSYLSLWRAFCVFAENQRSAVKSIGPVVFRWYVPSLDAEYSSPIVRFETACLCSLYVSASFNAGTGFEDAKLAKEYFLAAYRIAEGIWKHEILSWTLRKERELPFEATLSGCATAKMICLLALQRRAVGAIVRRIGEARGVAYAPGTVPKILIAAIRLCLWWYVAADRLAKTLASRRLDYPKLNPEHLAIARSHRESSFWLLFYFSALAKENEGKYAECVAFASALPRQPYSEADPLPHSKEWISREVARMVDNNEVIWLANKSEKSPWELLPCEDGVFFLEEEGESASSPREEFGEEEMRKRLDFLLQR